MTKSLAAVCCFLFLTAATANAQVVRSAVGADAAAILPSLNQFRADLGTLNANGPCTLPCAGHRETRGELGRRRRCRFGPERFFWRFFQSEFAGAGRPRPWHPILIDRNISHERGHRL